MVGSLRTWQQCWPPAKPTQAGLPSAPGRMSGVVDPDVIISVLKWSALDLLLDAITVALILLMIDILLKVPRLRLIVMFCSRFIITGRLCCSCPALNTLALTLPTCTRTWASVVMQLCCNDWTCKHCWATNSFLMVVKCIISSMRCCVYPHQCAEMISAAC